MTHRVWWTPTLLLAGAIGLGFAQAQEQSGTAEINLRKSIGVREFQGRQISGEERQIGRGDSLWRILIEEKGVPERRFRSYLAVIHGLNPQLKNLDTLRVGDKIFLPLRLDDIDKAPARAEAAPASPATLASGRTVNYQVKAGDHLYRILRDRFKLTDERRIAQYLSLVKDLNPERKTWNSLAEGEVIRLPADGPYETAKTERRRVESAGAAPQAQASGPPPQAKSIPLTPSGERQTMNAIARENVDVLLNVARAIGNEAERSGEEVINLPEGAVRLDRSVFPVIYNPVLRQRVVIDPDGKIPVSLKSKLNDPRVGTPVVSVAGDVNVAEAVRQLLAGVGYQSLPNDKPVVIQDAGIAVEARGNWIFLAPAVNNRTQEVLVVNLTERANEIPDYLTSALAKQGLYLREIVIPSGKDTSMLPSGQSRLKSSGPPKELPKDRREFIDALLLSFHVPFTVAETIPVDLGTGLRVDTLIDRVFEIEGKRTAIVFRRIDSMIRKALLERHGTTAVEIEVNALSSREIIGRLLEMFGERTVYGEHRFAGADGAAKDRVTLKAWGFHLPARSMFLTDRQIPSSLHRFFFEKGLDIVYFR
jgi:hypothetical protein